MSSLFNFSFQPCMCVDSYWDRDWKILHFKFLSADSDLKQKERIKDTSENKYATDKNAIKVRIHGLSYPPAKTHVFLREKLLFERILKFNS